MPLDRAAAHLKDEMMPRYAEFLYTGVWCSPKREMQQALIDKSMQFVSGQARLKLNKGSVWVVGRESPYSLYDQDLVTFEEGAVAYDQRHAAGFIKLNALRLRTLGSARGETQRLDPRHLDCSKLKLQLKMGVSLGTDKLWQLSIRID